MGMFDSIELKMPCPECGAEIDGFQSKDGDCVLATLQPYETQYCYSGCDKCGAWVELSASVKARDIMQLQRDAMNRKIAHYYHAAEEGEWFDVESEPKAKRFGGAE